MKRYGKNKELRQAFALLEKAGLNPTWVAGEYIVANHPWGATTEVRDLKHATSVAIRAQVESAWLSRAATQGYKPKSAKYANAEVEFFVGAMAAIAAVFPRENGSITSVVPPSWIIDMMSGSPIAFYDEGSFAGQAERYGLAEIPLQPQAMRSQS